MAYNVPFTDETNKGTITVEDKSINTADTSLALPGRLLSDYGLSLNSNFLHLLENFANVNPPINPVEGQLWYDTTDGVDQLKIYDGTSWVAAGGLKKGSAEPAAGNSVVGDIWVDTTNSQLYLYSGSGWVLVGPEYSTGNKSGALVELIIGVDSVQRTCIVNYALDAGNASTIVSIISGVEFTPKSPIAGYGSGVPLKVGINPNLNIGATFNGTATKANNLIVSGATIAAEFFLRSNVINQLTQKLLVRANGGIEIGVAKTLSITAEGSTGVIEHSIPGANIDFRVNNGGTPAIPIRLKSNSNVGINNPNPVQSLDVVGNIQTDSHILVTGTTDNNQTTAASGSIQTAGGLGVAKNAFIGGNTIVEGNVTVGNLIPGTVESSLGSSTNAFKNLYASNIVGKLTGDVTGNVSGSAGSTSKLKSATTFRLNGDVSSSNVTFDGQTGGLTKTFTTTISESFISGKDAAVSVDGANDNILIEQGGVLAKATPDQIFGTVVTVPVGTMTMFAGDIAPDGWALCNGQELAWSSYNALASALGIVEGDNTTWRFGGNASGFYVPDMRGRFAAGAGRPGGGNRIDANAVENVGGVSGNWTTTIEQRHLPEHTHDLRDSNTNQYYATTNSVYTGGDAFAGNGDTAGTGTRLQTAGGVVDLTNDEIEIVNPFLAVNFIIYTGVHS